ncbi:hypothetical protein POSPLADRAFT_1131599 [Postia placenta MAD-698-R-SB12]|uniref:Uncharacterized protein n=1 Tax=Postia placenta MAD-698-R-SB12 TaxID=670580 RepID=A0A1X6NE23_9APHY|nr:hypothetical protein POSPLADRAFT_1131599 [Postia placenta MAD-698-R-SB12]OSX66686.1 hypothetical protein POSPLADRAFT_1131599 [Postia placenta MAD-698-R-SB12]
MHVLVGDFILLTTRETEEATLVVAGFAAACVADAPEDAPEIFFYQLDGFRSQLNGHARMFLNMVSSDYGPRDTLETTADLYHIRKYTCHLLPSLNPFCHLPYILGELFPERRSNIAELDGNLPQHSEDSHGGPLAEVPIERIVAMFDTNVFSILCMAKAVFSHMASRKSGTIVNIGSVVGGMRRVCCYGGQRALHLQALYMECAPFGITVVHAAPGAIQSNLAANSAPSFGLPENSLYTSYLGAIIARGDMTQGGAMTLEEFARRTVSSVLRPKPPR